MNCWTEATRKSNSKQWVRSLEASHGMFDQISNTRYRCCNLMQVVSAKSAASTQVVESSDDTPGPESEIAILKTNHWPHF